MTPLFFLALGAAIGLWLICLGLEWLLDRSGFGMDLSDTRATPLMETRPIATTCARCGRIPRAGLMVIWDGMFAVDVCRGACEDVDEPRLADAPANKPAIDEQLVHLKHTGEYPKPIALVASSRGGH